MASLTSINAPLEPDLPLDNVVQVPAEVLTLPHLQTHAARRRAARSAGSLLPLTDLLAAGFAVVAVSLVIGRVPAVVAMALAPAWVGLLLLTGSYPIPPCLPARGVLARQVFRAAVLLGVLCWVVTTLAEPFAWSGRLLFLAVAMTGATLLTREGVSQVLAAGGASSRVRLVLAGESQQVWRTVEELRRSKRPQFEVVSVCVTSYDERVPIDVPVRVGLDQVVAAARDSSAGAVAVLPHDDIDPLFVQRLGWELETSATELYVGTPLLDVSTARTSVVRAGGLRMLHVRHAHRRGPGAVVKGVCERAAAVALVIALLPLLAVIAVLVRWDSAGPAVFRQQRVGRSGRLFTMYKFRTMRIDAEEQIDELVSQNEADGPLFKVIKDPRITRIGAVLRTYSLDELPQLFNVVLGQMSMVGPRPALASEVAQYGPDPHRRLAVKPGITGLWQVSGRSDLSWEESVRLDLAYVDNWSLLLDAQIACRTVGAVLGRRGAY